MCGIVGVVGAPVPGPDILDTLAHRGPDGRGHRVLQVGERAVFLGHTRLAILDLSPAGHQPMASRDGRWWITFNGEIYNHLELRRSLDGPFRGHSDTETLVEHLAAHGVEATVRALNGMYAFAALDTLRRRLYLVRDPFGIKPLYVARQGERLAFASEVRALRALGMTGPVDPDGLQLFLALRYTPAPRSLWRHVGRVAPGHIVELDLDRLQQRQHHVQEPTPHDFQGSLEEAVEAWRTGVARAVRRQLLSDVPVGVLLSGGIDSALVAAMAREAGAELPCFSVGFGGDQPECELADAEETARVLGLPFHPVTVTPEGLLASLPEVARALEEPLGTTSVLPMWSLVRRTRQDVTVVLTGQGTDEPWGGYRRVQVELLRSRLPRAFPWRLLEPCRRLRRWPEVVERGLRTLPVEDLPTRLVEASALLPAEDRAMLTGRSDDGGARELVAEWVAWLAPAGCEPAEVMMRTDARMQLADDLLLYGDKISMAVALEARVPMLDVELMRLAESLPLRYRVAPGRTKIVHKKMAERYLPEAIVHRPKRGFNVPFGTWSRGPWRGPVEQTLLEGPHLGHLERTGLERIWREHLAGRPGRARQVFALFMLALWWREQG